MSNLKKIASTLLLVIAFSVSCLGQNSSDLEGTYVWQFEWGGTDIVLKGNGTFDSHTSDCTQVFTTSGPYSVANGVIHFTGVKSSVRSFSDNKEHDLRKRSARKKYLDTDEPFKVEQWDLTIVKWGSRVYLLDVGEFDDFVNAINLGFEPREKTFYRGYLNRFFLREGDQHSVVEGKPSLPPTVLVGILSTPVIATITQVEPTKDDFMIATIDRGSDEGLRKDMTLVYFSDNPVEAYQFSGWRITSTEGHSARVEVYGKVKIGDKLTTRVADVSRFGID